MTETLAERIDPFSYRCRMDTDYARIVDGDTIDITTDLGRDIHHGITARLADVNTAEVHNTAHDSEAYQQGMIHETFVRKWFEVGEDESHREWPFALVSEKDETGKFGRFVAYIYRYSDGNCLNEDIIEAFPETEVDYS